jgi:biotin transport system substrate-specific component
MQTLAVLLIGMFFGPRLGVAAVMAYLAAGTMLPLFFAPGSAGLMGPTGGYLLGFVPAVWLAGRLISTERIGRFAALRVFAVCTLATAAIFICGLIWLSVYTGGEVVLAVQMGLVPHLAGAAIKIAMAVAVFGMMTTTPRRFWSAGDDSKI